jgi:hypothetical protein
MTISETVELFNADVHRKKNNPYEYSCAGMLNLPVPEPKYKRNHFHGYICSISFDNMQFLQMHIDKFNSGVVVDMPSTKMNHGQYPIIEHTFEYINQIYSQWETIANTNGIKLDDKFALQKQAVIDSVEENTKTFQTFSKFISDYNKVYKSYYENIFDPNESSFYQEELNQIAKDYSDILNMDTALFFHKNSIKGDYGKEVNQIGITFDQLEALSASMRDSINEHNPNILATMAYKFIQEPSDEFINKRIDFTASQKISSLVEFKDGSLVVRYRNGEYTEVNLRDIESVNEELIESTIDYKFRKKPQLAKFMIGKFYEDKSSFKDVDVVVETFLNNEQILKNAKFDFTPFIDKSFETIDDAMNAKVHEYKIERYANSILSNKYKHFMTPEALVVFKELYEAKVSSSELQDLIGKKLAAMETPEDFKNYITKVWNVKNKFCEENLQTKLDAAGIKPILSHNNVVVFEVKNFQDSKDLGSPSWCISREQYHFSSYTKDDKKQFFIYDFSKPSSDKESMIGITLKKDGTFSNQHLKNDDSVEPTDFLRNIQKKLIVQEVDRYALTDEFRRELGLSSQTLKEDNETKQINAIRPRI